MGESGSGKFAFGTSWRAEKETNRVVEIYKSQKEAKAKIINTSYVGAKLDENAAAVHAMLAQELPKQVIIQTSQENNRYLHLYKEHPVLPNALQFAGDYSFELETRFEVEPATTGTGLVRIRSMLNNKYWKNSDVWVSAMADKPKEDQPDDGTLFQPVFLYSDNIRVLRLRHVLTGKFVTFYHGKDADDQGLLSLLPPGGDLGYDVCTFIDWKSVVVLPNLVRIKSVNQTGDKEELVRKKAEDRDVQEDLYIKASVKGYLNFENKVDDSSMFDFEVHPSRDGGIRLKSVYRENYWTEMEHSNIWVILMNQPDHADSVHGTNTVFLPTLVHGKNRIMLRCLKNDMFCQRNIASKNEYESLASFATYPDDQMSYMEIVEPVDERTVDNVNYYNFENARRYNERRLAFISDDVSNRTDGSVTSDINLKFELSDKYTWNTGTQFTLAGKMTLTAGIPDVLSIGIEVRGSFTEGRNFGEEKTKVVERDSEKSVVVEPGKRVKSSWTGTRLSYDVPFSYTQYDKLSSGRTKEYKKYDGILTCHDGYEYKYENQETDLEPLTAEEESSLRRW